MKENCEMIAIDLSKKLALDVDPIAFQQINFIGILAQCCSLLKKAKKLFWTFHKNCESFVNVLCIDLIWIDIKWLNAIVQI